jgi:hypothetical protein
MFSLRTRPETGSDWAGEFNSYIVPFANFGAATISRSLQPQLAEFLYSLSASDGADRSRAAKTGSSAARNGEPEGELGVVRQQDFDWGAQTGAPADPQAGNIPGGGRDVVRSADFNDGTANDFAPDRGTWTVVNGAFRPRRFLARRSLPSVMSTMQWWWMAKRDFSPGTARARSRATRIKPTIASSRRNP